MTLNRYLDLLKSGRIWFSRASTFPDKYECCDPIERFVRRVSAALGFQGDATPFLQELRSEGIRAVTVGLAHDYLVTCWHGNEGESEAMWKLYAQSKGVAIQTSQRAIEQAFSDPKPQFGWVRYDWHDKIKTPPQGLLYIKDPSFSHEQEYRGILHTTKLPYGAELNDKGALIPVNVSSLIQKVVLSPELDASQLQDIENKTRSLGHSFPVEPSYMATQPADFDDLYQRFKSFQIKWHPNKRPA